MKIVQLSDVHFGTQFRDDIFNQVIDEVNELSPDAVIITGDLTNEGLKEEYEGCKELISKINVKKIIAVSGNHDYRNTGYLHFKKYFPFQTINELDDDVVVVTLGTARPDRDEGEVGYRQTLWLERTMKKFENKVTILAMHHHLIGIPDTGSDRLTIIDAGDVLRLSMMGYRAGKKGVENRKAITSDAGFRKAKSNLKSYKENKLNKPDKFSDFLDKKENIQARRKNIKSIKKKLKK